MSQAKDQSARASFGSHSRAWRENRYVYPVCSRRSGGVSIGVNLSRDLACTFNCVYCQVDRRRPGDRRPVDLAVLDSELADMLASAASGRLLAEPEFADLPAGLRRVNDVAFSGDGEPTACPTFAEAVELAERAVVSAGLDLTLVLITNGSLLDRPAVQRGLETLHRRRGQVWAKVDAGTAGYFRRVGRTNVPFERVLRNIAATAGRWPIVIQSCFFRLDGQPPPAGEIDAWCDRLGEVLGGGGRIELVQVYTVARPPAERFVTPLSADEVDAIVARIIARLPGLAVRPFYGPG